MLEEKEGEEIMTSRYQDAAQWVENNGMHQGVDGEYSYWHMDYPYYYDPKMMLEKLEKIRRKPMNFRN